MSLNKSKLEQDELNVKMHLNASFEYDGIRVSEELMNRTLASIKKVQEDSSVLGEAVVQQEYKRAPWGRYIRNVAVVAAGIILFVGINSFGGNFSKKDSSEKNFDSARYDMSAPESALDNGLDGVQYSEEAIEQDTANATLKGAPDMMDADARIGDEKKDIPVEIEENAGGLGNDVSITHSIYGVNIYTLSYENICPFLEDMVESITIIDSSSDNSIFLSNKTDIQLFYELMSSFTFAEGAKSFGSDKFIIRINSSVDTFTMTIEDSFITTNYMLGKDKTEDSYDVSDHEALLTEIEQLYQKYNQ